MNFHEDFTITEKRLLLGSPNREPWFEALILPQAQFPGDTPEHYPAYLLGWLVVVSPATSARIVHTAQVQTSAVND